MHVCRCIHIQIYISVCVKLHVCIHTYTHGKSYDVHISTSTIMLTPSVSLELLLVGGFTPSEKYQSLGMIILNIWKNMEKHKMFQTTNQPLYCPNQQRSHMFPPAGWAPQALRSLLLNSSSAPGSFDFRPRSSQNLETNTSAREESLW